MKDKKESICEAAPKLIFPCSGAADVGEISDLASRRLSKKGTGKMFCLAGIGSQIPGIVKTAKSAAKILIIDGCSIECARLCFEQAGISEYDHMIITDMGLEKGKSAPTDANIEVVMQEAENRLKA